MLLLDPTRKFPHMVHFPCSLEQMRLSEMPPVLQAYTAFALTRQQARRRIVTPAAER